LRRQLAGATGLCDKRVTNDKHGFSPIATL
jgi:hypothetical protein